MTSWTLIQFLDSAAPDSRVQRIFMTLFFVKSFFLSYWVQPGDFYRWHQQLFKALFEFELLTRGRRNRLRGYVRNRGTGRLRIFFASERNHA